MTATTATGTEPGIGSVERLGNQALERQIVTVQSQIESVGGGGTGTGGRAADLSIDNFGDTLPTDVDIFFADIHDSPGGYAVTLPDASEMRGRELTFVNVGDSSEYSVEISGPIHGVNNNTYMLSNGMVAKMACDGTNWWITSEVD